MDYGALFRGHLVTSLDSCIWAVSQVPTGRLYTLPLPVFGEWPAAQIIFHLAWCDQNIITPHMRQWLGEEPPDPASHARALQIEDWRANETDMPDLLNWLRETRTEQIDLLEQFAEADWMQVRTIPWGDLPLYWLYGRAYQHMIEHTDTLLKMALFWDIELARQRASKD